MKKPIMLYDGDCGFCQHWIEEWSRFTGERIQYAPFQKMLTAYPQVTEKQCRESVQLIMPDGSVLSGAHAVLKALDIGKGRSLLLWLYEHLPLFAPISECFYNTIARHRPGLSRSYRNPKCKI
jgi:predicted DCC family thiol-disulfide oxidoreductase YuxK